jgi:pyruvate/2-oxoglutarate dehydrogenase complex dihydrolipoamide acyltransferase (E2) component
MQENKIKREEVATIFSTFVFQKQMLKITWDPKNLRRQRKAVHLPEPGSREVERKKMSTLRLKLAKRLVAVKQETAMLTTFNEVNMSKVIALRNNMARL